MGKITFILGGARSGKSTYALGLANKYKNVAFIATCRPLDKEMKKRIASHKKLRPIHWQTFECPDDIAGLLKKMGNKFDLILLDCLTLLICDLASKGIDQELIERKMGGILAELKKIKAGAIIVSNELGLGIVPRNKMARDFRDTAGRVNQVFAKQADKVFFMAAGIPIKIKG